MNITLAFDQYLAIHRYKYLALYHALRAGILEEFSRVALSCRLHEVWLCTMTCRADRSRRCMKCCSLMVM